METKALLGISQDKYITIKVANGIYSKTNHSIFLKNRCSFLLPQYKYIEKNDL